jgi:hypothetical protein
MEGEPPENDGEEVQFLREEPRIDEADRPPLLDVNNLNALLSEEHVTILSATSVRVDSQEFEIKRFHAKDVCTGRYCYRMPIFQLHPKAMSWALNQEVSESIN